MYAALSSSSLRGGPIPFENRGLFNAVQHISHDLVKRTSLSVGDRQYASLLSDILGRSHYSTIELLAQKRKLAATTLQQDRHALTLSHSRPSPLPKRLKPQQKPDHTARARDRLVALLLAPRPAPPGERHRTLDIVNKLDRELNVEALRILWGIPKVVTDISSLYTRLVEAPRDVVLALYDRLIAPASPDSRVFNLLFWKENCVDKGHSMHDGCLLLSGRCPGVAPRGHGLRSVSRPLVANVVRSLLSKRSSPFFRKNMEVAVETVLYAIHPDRFIPRFREHMLRDASFYRGLQAYEYSWSYEGSLENLSKGKLNRMLKDIRAVRDIDPPTLTNSHGHQVSSSSISSTSSSSSTSRATSSSANGYAHPNGMSVGLSLRAIRNYCAERDTLTDRALRAVHDRYVRRRRANRGSTTGNRSSGTGSRATGGSGSGSTSSSSGSGGTTNGYVGASNSGRRGRTKKNTGSGWSGDDARMTVGDFVRMYLALVGCQSDPGLRYWFGVLDQDGDGRVGVGDVAHFYTERKAESERRNGVLLADVHWLWVRLCAMGGVRPDGPGLDLAALQALGKDEREFVMCALLVRRADDGKLADVASTIAAGGGEGGQTMRIRGTM